MYVRIISLSNHFPRALLPLYTQIQLYNEPDRKIYIFDINRRDEKY